MMRHPAIHIAIIVLIAALLTLVARGCDGDHESEGHGDAQVSECSRQVVDDDGAATSRHERIGAEQLCAGATK